MNYWTYIEKRMQKSPRAMLREGDKKISFGGALALIKRLSGELSGDCYAILCRSRLACAISALACEAAGKCAMILPLDYGAEGCMQILRRHCPSGIITDIYGGLDVLELGNSTVRLGENPPSVIFHTSGSTGAKKGVMLDSEAIMTNLLDIAEYFPVTEGDKILIFRSLSHASALTAELLLGLYRSADIYFYSGSFSPRAIAELIEREKITVISGTPTTIGAIASMLRGGEGESIRLISVSGERVSEGAAARIRRGFPHAKIFSGYGLTEASPRVAYLPPELFDKDFGAAGIALGSVALRISPEGELLVRSRSVMRGYLGERELTKRTLSGGWLHTGDCAFIGSDGLLYIRGRLDGMINRAGLNIYPAEIENALSGDARVRGVVAYGYDADGEQRIGIKLSGDFSDLDEVWRLCRERLPAYMMPSRAELLQSLEIACGGKLQRRLGA